MDCISGCSNLTVNFPAIQETTDYEVESIPFNPPSSFNGLQNVDHGIDDRWSDVINLPFDFSFFGNTYSALLFSPNGAVTFKIENAGNYHQWNFSETLPNSTNTAFSQANIFGAMHDMNAFFRTDDEISWEIIGTAPFRSVVISYYNNSHYSSPCVDLRTTQMVVLYETTNVIEIYLQDKPSCTFWNNGNAVLGIQNHNGTLAVVPPGRNTGPWEATNEAWRFDPSGAVFESSYAWSNGAGQIIATSPMVNVCPTENETFEVEISYYNFSISGYETYTEEILLYTGLIGESPADLQVCSDVVIENFNLTQQTSIITGGSTCSVVTYYESLMDAENATNAISNPDNYTNATNPQTIFVRVDDMDSADFETASFNLQIDLLPATSIVELEVCSLTSGFAEFDLNALSELITVPNSGFIFSYYASSVDAENDLNSLVSPYTNTVVSRQLIIAKVTDPNTGCFVFTDCYLNVLQGTELQDVTLIKCDDNANDGFTEFNLEAVLPEILNGQNFELTFYESEADANSASNPLLITDSFTNTVNPQTIFVRGDNINTGCVGFSTIELSVEESINLVAPSPLTVCDLDSAQDGFTQFRLSEKNSEIIGSLEPGNFEVSYFETLLDAEANLNTLNAATYNNVTAFAQTVFVRVDNVSVGCFAITTLDLVVDMDCGIGCQELVTICYTSNDTRAYVYTSDNGSPITIVFNAGRVENNFDALIVLDSDGITEIYNGYGAAGDLTGLTFTSTGDTLTVKIVSDGSVSCESSGFTPIEFNVFCLNIQNSIEVNAFIDVNGNSIFDASELVFNKGVFSYEMNNDGVINYVNSSYGSFIIPNTEVGNTYDISFIMYNNYTDCLAQTFTLIENVTPIEGETVTVNFPLTTITNCSDVAVNLISFVPPRPGQVLINYLVVQNLGSIPVSGSVEFVHDNLVTFNSVTGIDLGNTITNTSTGFILNFNNLLPGNEEQVYVKLNVPTNLNIGDFITNSAFYRETDLDATNNASILTEAVVNSYDPNNKTESHGPEITLADFTNDDYLYYTINFQNLGTAEALEIKVEDVLDSQLDATTFKMLHASHDYVVTRMENNLTWQFDAINLPSESMDEANSHGYVYFKIKPVAGYSYGDVIPNTADIYFDYNPAITTNTFETTFVNSLSVAEFSTIGYKMYPNPTNKVLNFQFNTAHVKEVLVQVYDLQGKLVLNHSSISEGNRISFNVSSLSKGMYFVKLKGDNFEIVEKLIID
ncbi:MAG: T9SS type A sorting domain-containing protein [Xanthomarina sp.]